MKIIRKAFTTPHNEKPWSPSQFMVAVNNFIEQVGKENLISITEHPALRTKVDSTPFYMVVYYWGE